MDEEKATKDKKSPKNTLFSFQRFAFNGSLKYSLKLRKQLFQSTLHISDGKQVFFKTQNVFFDFLSATAMNMISGLN